MRTRVRSLAPITFILPAGCSENRLGVGAVDAASHSGTGGLSTSGTGGTSGPWSNGTGGKG